MSHIQQSLVRDLKRFGVLTEQLSLANGYHRKLQAVPELWIKVIEHTSFLLYDATLNVRIQCICNGIHQQPLCEVCNGITKMRVSGRFRYTFPTFCSSKCSAGYDLTIIKRRLTYMKKA